MAIVETKIVSRPNTGIPFFTQSNNPLRLTAKEAVATALGGTHTIVTDTPTYLKTTNASGSHVIEYRYSVDLLTQTSTVTFDSLETFSIVDNATSVALDNAYFVYAEANGFTHPSTGQYTLTGIVAPFTCTTTYTYSSSDDSFFNIFTSSLEVSDKLTSFTNTGTQLIAVHAYTNSTDFTNNHWKDNSFINFLHELGITRTIAYAMI